MATLGLTAPEKEAVEAFRRDVVEPSMTQLVVIDFWAEWCGPCKALTPILEKVTADYADRGVVLAKIDTDKNQFIAAQFQIRSIPTVYAMFQGQLVADLTQARTESQLRQMLDQLLQQLPVEPAEPAGPDIEPLVAMGEQALGEGDAMRALSIFEQVAEIAPTHPQVLIGRIRALLALGDHDTAQTALDVLPPEVAKLPAVDQVRATLALARDAQPVDDLAGLKAEVAAQPDDHDARFRLAGALMAAGDRDGTAEQLLTIVAADRSWNEDAARQQLLKLFEAVGLEDPWASQQRRKLSAILFG